MTRAFLVFTLILFFIAPGHSRISPPPVVEGGPVSPFRQLRFEENKGQADPRVRFAGRAGGYQVYLTDSGLELHSGPAAVRIRFEGASQPNSIRRIAPPPIPTISATTRRSGSRRRPSTRQWRGAASIPASMRSSAGKAVS